MLLSGLTLVINWFYSYGGKKATIFTIMHKYQKSGGAKKYYTQYKKKIISGGLVLVAILIGFTIFSFVFKENVDVFEGVSLNYSGISGMGNAKVDTNGRIPSDSEKKEDFLRSVDFVLDKQTDLENGQIITLSAILPVEKMKEYKMKAKVTTMDFTVEGLPTVAEIIDSVSSKVKVKFSGVNGEGKAEIISENINIDNDRQVDVFISNLMFSLDKQTNLENDEEISLTIKVPSDYSVQLEKDFVKKIKVEGLNKIPENLEQVPNLTKMHEDLYNEIAKASYGVDTKTAELVKTCFASNATPTRPLLNTRYGTFVNIYKVKEVQKPFFGIANENEYYTYAGYTNITIDSGDQIVGKPDKIYFGVIWGPKSIEEAINNVEEAGVTCR